MREETKQALVSFLENREKIDVAGNALLICQDGKEVFRHFSEGVNENTLFRIYSMTKVVTVTAALQLYELGKFAMDDLLSDYLPEYKDMKVWDAEKSCAYPAKNQIRIRDLFCMSAGLTYPGEGSVTASEIAAIASEIEKKKGYTTQEFARAIAKAPLLFEPGTHWCYSLCHDVLGALIEVVSGQTLGEYMTEHIFKPLHMEHTFFRLPDGMQDRLAEKKADGFEDDKYQADARYESGGGGLLSTADDYMKFAKALTRGGTNEEGVRILGRKTIDLLRLDQPNPEQKKDYNWEYLKGYGYGLGVRTYVDPAVGGIQGTVGEFGWCGVLGTWVLMDPEEKLSVVYMHQRYPNLEKYVQTHLRAMIYGDL